MNWLEPIVLLFGLGIAIWTFLRCHKRAYLLFALYFALAALLSPINRAYRAYQAPDVSTQQKIDAALKKVLAEENPPVFLPVYRNIYFPFGQILLVAGLWLVARREPYRTNPMPSHASPAP
jgi:hypothetical protein